MDLRADEQQKKRVARKAMTGTAGGRFMLALTVVLLGVTVACPAVVGGWMSGGGAASIGLDGAEGLEWGLAFFFLAMTIMCGAIWFRQRNRRCALRREERVMVDGGQLLYRYVEELGLANARAEGIGEGWLGTKFQRTVRIDLARVRVTRNKALAEWVFDGGQGGIFGLDPARPQGYEIPAFQLGDYFGPELGQALARYVR